VTVRKWMTALIIAVLQTSLAQLGVPDANKQIITDSVIVVAVRIDSIAFPAKADFWRHLNTTIWMAAYDSSRIPNFRELRHDTAFDMSGKRSIAGGCRGMGADVIFAVPERVVSQRVSEIKRSPNEFWN
jgi:hypothetical protein